jgi:hypothetical protein
LVDLNAEAVPHGSEVVGLGKVPQPVVLVNIQLFRLYLNIYSTTFFLPKMLAKVKGFLPNERNILANVKEDAVEHKSP